MQSNISTKGKMEFSGRLHLPQCQSTNDEMQHILAENRNSLPEGFLLSTGHQTAGRGQRGSRWDSEPEKNLLFSLLLRPKFLDCRYAFRLTATLALAIARVLEVEFPEMKLKWPNDLYLQEKKLGGMLIETVISGPNLERAVCGIGLNINQANPGPQAVSLYDVLGKELDREKLLQQIYQSLMQEYSRLRNGEWPAIRQAYLARLFRLGQPSWFRLPDGTRFQAVLKSVSEEGELILICRDGEKRFRFKEVQFEIQGDHLAI